MKISLNWLSDYIALPPEAATPQALTAALVQLGHEVDAVSDLSAQWPGVVIGKITERIQHPNADRLGVCQVDVGAAHGGVRQIVCGAPNARTGLTVAVALPGAVLPGDFKISISDIRGQTSNGMICSLDELGMAAERAEGIWEMTTKAAFGTPLVAALGKNDIVLDVAVTPNRGDALSHYGLARDLAALGVGKLKSVKAPKVGTAPCTFSVGTETDGCPVINGVEVRHVTNKPSPAWLQARLEAVGVKPRNIVVDATNYVMLALGQPLHAYDAAKITGGITAKAAQGGETYHGLMDTKLTLAAGDTVIGDANGIVGLAGILGGEGSAVSESTTHVLLEAATFTRETIARTGQAHQLTTDARYRFERGVDPAIAPVALALCASLIAKHGKGQMSTMVRAGTDVTAPAPIQYAPTLCATFGGLDVPAKRQKAILKALGFDIKTGKVWAVTPPTFRTYMANPEDLVEEVLRVVGYENIPNTLPVTMAAQTNIDGTPVTLDRRARKALAANGFSEAMTYSFIGRTDAELFAPRDALVDIVNPLAQTNMTTMRPSLLPGLLRALAGNMAHKDVTAKLGEVGKVFTVHGERLAAAGVMVADGVRHWKAQPIKPDVFTAKAAALLVLETLDAPVGGLMVEANAGAMYHPGKSGTLRLGPLVLARFGELHPKVLKHFDIPAVAVFEVELEPLLKMNPRAKTWQVHPYPAVKRDVAFIVPASVSAAAVQNTLRGVDRDLIQTVEVFDMYVGEHVPAGKKSLALGLTLQSPERTLTDADITAVMDKAIAAAATKHGAELRK